jgi:DNA-binding CsgD family transcriptional regulator
VITGGGSGSEHDGEGAPATPGHGWLRLIPGDGGEARANSLCFLVTSSSRTLLSSAIEAMISHVYPGAIVATAASSSDEAWPGAGIRIMLDGAERWMLLGQGMGAREVAEGIAHGAWSVVPADGSQREFEQGLRALVDGDAPFVARALCRELALRAVEVEAAHSTLARLFSERERQVIALVAGGASNAEIAAKMGISINTVRTHLQALFAKLQVQSRLRLVSRARELGLVEG